MAAISTKSWNRLFKSCQYRYCAPYFSFSQGGIYTISYEEEADPGGSPDNPYDPEDDLHMDAFDDSQHILKVDRALAVATLVVR